MSGRLSAHAALNVNISTWRKNWCIYPSPDYIDLALPLPEDTKTYWLPKAARTAYLEQDSLSGIIFPLKQQR
ncbi:hypothetical protein BC939DRAFT_505724 [Gamsiella multidivaricata]|uniref:uncharacterized protein n=1 Tax=Gamsiella multidivaricata TaxID=101098 RepID=UPI0022211191|nr:uncharacterized protein BC939DRAFT_505724 [Gamsiella multidivaricata]KAI7819373.1 hypothetical protein BC939DRAFT_505724 [Gamsiella multidivaricata]